MCKIPSYISLLQEGRFSTKTHCNFSTSFCSAFFLSLFLFFFWLSFRAFFSNFRMSRDTWSALHLSRRFCSVRGGKLVTTMSLMYPFRLRRRRVWKLYCWCCWCCCSTGTSACKGDDAMMIFVSFGNWMAVSSSSVETSCAHRFRGPKERLLLSDRNISARLLLTSAMPPLATACMLPAAIWAQWCGTMPMKPPARSRTFW